MIEIKHNLNPTHGVTGPRQYTVPGKPDVILSDRCFQRYANKKQLGKLQGGEFYQRQLLFDE